MFANQRLMERGLDRHWQVYEMYHVRPAITGNGHPSQHDIAEQLDFPTENAVSDAIRTVRKKLDIVLREVIRETVTDPAEAHEEYERLRAWI